MRGKLVLMICNLFKGYVSKIYLIRQLSKYKVTKMFIIVYMFMLFFQNTNAFAEDKIEKHVLIINPFTQDYPGSQLYIKGIKEALGNNSEFSFSYSYEYADLGRHSNDEKYLEDFSKYLKAKYWNDEPDFIISAVTLNNFFLKYGDNVFPKVPIIIDWDKEKLPVTQLPQNYTIISQMSEVDQNIQLILKTKPLTKKIYIVVGSSVDKRNLSQSISDAQEKYSNQVEFSILDKLTYGDMIDTLKNAEGDSAILYFQWYSDINGESFIPTEVIKTICKEAKVPVYGVSAQYLGSGVIGGYVGNQELVGQTAGKVVVDILNGNKVSGNRIIHAASREYAFDWRQLKRWKIDEGKLPSDSVILYRDMSVWELYKGYIITAFVILVVESLLIFILLINIRKRKKAENELVQANNSLKTMTEKLISVDKMKDEFLINTSHELQTPLNGIINISEILAEGKCGNLNKKQKEELQVILSASRRLSLLIKDIIDFERIQRNEIEFNIKPIDIVSASKVVISVLKHLIKNKNIEVLINISERISPVLADENRLLQVLYNLIGNAIKFTKNGAITLMAQENEQFIKFSIKDTGIGISKEKQKNLFHAFIQAETEIFSNYGGNGLGLYISKQLLERMGGKIFLEWSEPQKGTCFSFLLPKSAEKLAEEEKIYEQSSEETHNSKEVQNKSNNDLKILAIDDEPTNLRVLKSILDNEEYEILTASNGIQALEIIRTNSIDLVLVDVMMNGMNGYETCSKIREEHSLHELPVIILTVRDTAEDIETAFLSGANDFVTKPFVAKELRARVSNLMQMKKSVQKALNNEMAFLQSQIKPHFLYNAISTIMSLCYTDGERAGELLGHLSEYLQKSFNIDNRETTVSLENELELTRAYTEIEKARFGERLTVEYDIDDNLLKQRILPLTIQPLVENSIRHGLMKRKSGGIVKVVVRKEKDGILISVEDNGIGIENIEEIFKKKDYIKTRKGGVGISNIKKRLMKYYNTEIHLDSKINEGTLIYFIVKV
ncbi:ABC transporter substrate binding protein [Clostridium beijerinckii]|uniref:ABC transporter substrate binding protein n=3 Tax=Clostridium beijerinckii TaxID=1520 RepID=UPI0013614FC2|nr:ABC transporter substrate binding protein [Clostridium beijerinckii]MZK99847.1 response regulator [Clostridium beijerinckii]MZL29385.1 response regulator [Clostridium beijerinckii]